VLAALKKDKTFAVLRQLLRNMWLTLTKSFSSAGYLFRWKMPRVSSSDNPRRSCVSENQPPLIYRFPLIWTGLQAPRSRLRITAGRYGKLCRRLNLDESVSPNQILACCLGTIALKRATAS